MNKNKKLIIVMSVVLLIAVYAVTRFFESGNNDKDKKDGLEHNDYIDDDKESLIIALDAGHGGRDPGKVGVEGQLEKDINLEIVLRLKEELEKDNELNAKVVLTRSDDTGYYDEDTVNKKSADMKKRCEIIEEAKADIVVSIHQNSYHSSSVKGAQVFYYEKSEKGKLLANKIQARLVLSLSEENKGRVEKANDNYYLIMNVKCPAIIVECGFLSNMDEARLLENEEYQKKITKAIIEGIRDYLQQY